MADTASDSEKPKGPEKPILDSVDDHVLVKTTKLTDEQLDALQKIIDELPHILEDTNEPTYDEIFGYRINKSGLKYVDDSVRNEILLKFLAADEYNYEAARKRLVDTFNWRSKFQPLLAAYNEKFDGELDRLGVISTYDQTKDNLHVVTWNLYGNLKSPQKLFKRFGKEENTEKEGTPFLRWRIGLMERALLLVDFSDAKNSKIGQVHDYENVSMFRMDPGMKAATKEIISIFGANYPELLSTKFFINVPTIMSWMFTFVRTIGFISDDTFAKFRVLNNGNLAEWFGENTLPKAYNGQKETSVELLYACEAKTSAPEYAQVILERVALGVD